MSETPELAEVILTAIEARLVDLHVALPCRVESYDATTQEVQCVPLLHRVLRDADGNPKGEVLPKLPSVPVLSLRAGGFFFNVPVKAGDTGIVLFCDVSIDQWLGTPTAAADDVTTPGDERRHTLAAGVFLPGLYNTARRLTAGSLGAVLALGDESGIQLRQSAGGPMIVAVEGSTSLGFVALAAKCDDNIAKLTGAVAAAIAVITPAGGGPAAKAAFGPMIAPSAVPLDPITFPTSSAAASLKAE